MIHFSIEAEEASIVFVGSFNPAIFHPQWLLRNELIPEDDISGAKVEIVHNDISKFSLEWLGIDVLRNKFIARTNDPSKFSPLKDLMISIFKILEHMPIKQMGLNLIITYKVDDESSWHKIGDTLVPKSIWEMTLPKRIGMKSVELNCPRPDALRGEINVIVTPLRDKFLGVVFNVNNHIEIKFEQDQKKLELDVPTILSENWDQALTFARDIGNKTIVQALQL
jgi:hypothetical protein